MAIGGDASSRGVAQRKAQRTAEKKNIFLILNQLITVIHTRRLGSIDVVRALTMYLMVFVNDLWTDKKIPEWLEHAPAWAG